jgi:hypothetical protein
MGCSVGPLAEGQESAWAFQKGEECLLECLVVNGTEISMDYMKIKVGLGNEL